MTQQERIKRGKDIIKESKAMIEYGRELLERLNNGK